MQKWEIMQSTRTGFDATGRWTKGGGRARGKWREIAAGRVAKLARGRGGTRPDIEGCFCTAGGYSARNSDATFVGRGVELSGREVGPRARNALNLKLPLIPEPRRGSISGAVGSADHGRLCKFFDENSHISAWRAELHFSLPKRAEIPEGYVLGIGDILLYWMTHRGLERRDYAIRQSRISLFPIANIPRLLGYPSRDSLISLGAHSCMETISHIFPRHTNSLQFHCVFSNTDCRLMEHISS